MKSNEKNFINRLKRQEEDALEYVVDEYFPLVKGVVYKVLIPLQRTDLLEECMNDVFLSVWDNVDQFKGDVSDFRKWICAISKFKAIDYYRKVVKQMEVSSEHMDRLVESSIEDELIRGENREELFALMNVLEPMDREILLLKFFLGVKTEDIASQFGLTRAAVDNRIYRSKKKLRQQALSLKLGGILI